MFGDDGFGVFGGEEGLAAGGWIPNMDVHYVYRIFMKDFPNLKVVIELIFVAHFKTNDGDFFTLKFFTPAIEAMVSAASEDGLPLLFVEKFCQ